VDFFGAIVTVEVWGIETGIRLRRGYGGTGGRAALPGIRSESERYRGVSEFFGNLKKVLFFLIKGLC